LENAKKNLVFHFGGGRHASFPQKPVVKQFRYVPVRKPTLEGQRAIFCLKILNGKKVISLTAMPR
jgi:hypothetical protein